MAQLVHHFSEDPTITRFEPHIPVGRTDILPMVWAIDTDHAPLYWFPRDCPRVSAWPRNETEAAAFAAAFRTSARRVHAIEVAWLDRMRTTVIHRYDFDAEDFERYPDASGHWVSRSIVEPVAVTAIGDLLHLHARDGIELRIVPDLWPLHDAAVSDQWDFSMVRMRNASPRTRLA